MNAFNEGMYKPLPKCASGTLDPTALSRSCIASTKREGDIAHPIAIPTSRGTHFVVYVLVENLIMNPSKYVWIIWTTWRGTWWVSNVFRMSWCGTDPYAFAKSSHTTYKLSRRFLALWIASQIMEECSMQPGTPGTPPFWIDVTTYLLDNTYSVSLDAMTEKIPSLLHLATKWV